MKDKKNYKNLFDSIFLALLLALFIVIYLLCIWFGVINPREGTDPVATLIICTTLCGVITIGGIVIIVDMCEYWVLSDNIIYTKKPFCKRKSIKISEIEKVEKKNVYVTSIGLAKSDAYIIHSKTSTIQILIKPNKEYTDLDCILANFLQ